MYVERCLGAVSLTKSPDPSSIPADSHCTEDIRRLSRRRRVILQRDFSLYKSYFRARQDSLLPALFELLACLARPDGSISSEVHLNKAFGVSICKSGPRGKGPELRIAGLTLS